MTLASQYGGYKMPPASTYEPPAIEERRKVGLILRHARKEAGLTLSQASELSGVSRSTIGSIERGEHDLGSVTGKNMMSLHAAFGMSRAKFDSIVKSAYNTRVSTPLQTPSVVEITGYRMMPIYALASAGVDAAEAVPLHDYPPLMFPESSWHPALRMFLAVGDSTDSGRENSIRDGDIIHVDMRDLDPTPGRICIVQIPGQGVFVKRVQQFGAVMWLVSDNPDQIKYPPFQVDETHVLGSVNDITRRVRLHLS